jgi:hypothetical protein
MDLTFKFKKEDGGEKEYCLPFVKPKGGRWYTLSMDIMLRDDCLRVDNVRSSERESGQQIEVGKLEAVK